VEKVCFETGVKERKGDTVTVVTLMKTVIWHDQGSETVRQRLLDVDEALAKKTCRFIFNYCSGVF